LSRARKARAVRKSKRGPAPGAGIGKPWPNFRAELRGRRRGRVIREPPARPRHGIPIYEERGTDVERTKAPQTAPNLGWAGVRCPVGI
jgi:hypothetical protein